MAFQRTCVACGRKADRGELLRFVAGSGALVWDVRRGAPGRGAWCCPSPVCWERLPKMGKRLARVLRCGPLGVINLPGLVLDGTGTGMARTNGVVDE